LFLKIAYVIIKLSRIKIIKKMSVATIIYLILGLIILWAIYAFNSLVIKKNRVEEAWSDIEVQLKRRYDLIPNLVETVKGYASHEKTVLEDVTKARVSLMEAKDPKAKLEADNALTETLKTLFAVSENYPQLRANENFIKLQEELRDAEDKIQAARRFYNANVRDYNIAVEVFPKNIIASIFGFKKRELFDIDNPEERENIKVQF
jgi:LemA protein